MNGCSNWLEAAHHVHRSCHAIQRAAQRGLKLIDISLVMEFGELVDDGFLMSDKAISQPREVLKNNNRRKSSSGWIICAMSWLWKRVIRLSLPTGPIRKGDLGCEPGR